ncbi:hypothetical protein GGR53DRAFT_515438 [Hypoxylon sp. FL1150]|nr:hypothetical protein GGR53DRAFT_515438 [Hypoxylon sp. FL1150]
MLPVQIPPWSSAFIALCPIFCNCVERESLTTLRNVGGDQLACERNRIHVGWHFGGAWARCGRESNQTGAQAGPWCLDEIIGPMLIVLRGS